MPFFVFAVLVAIIIVILIVDSYSLAVKDEIISKLKANQLTQDALEDFVEELRNDYAGIHEAFWSGVGPDEECLSEEIDDEAVLYTINHFLEERC